MEKQKYLPLYYRWMKYGLGENSGLCDKFRWYDYNGEEVRTDKFFNLFSEGMPIYEYWAHSENCESGSAIYANDFTPLRQNIVLFMAAMNDEL